MNTTISSNPDQTVDYVVVGGGSAGAVIAARLAERGDSKVLLVEAGATGRHPLLMLPGAMTFVRDWSRHAWLYETEPDLSRNGRRDIWRRGRCLGGSSSINGMIWARGLPRDFDRWEALGARGWGWQDVLPYFIKSETAHGFNSIDRGQEGPIWVESFRSPHKLSNDLVSSFESSGLPFLKDINSADGLGVGITQTNQKQGIRQSTESSYLEAAKKLKSLEILTKARAERIIFTGTKATGITIQRDNRIRQNIHAHKEIIICAGAIESPALLLRSGIGPASQLQSLGIDVRFDSPEVGLNMQDHPDLYMEYAVNQSTYSNIARWDRLVSAGLEFFVHRRGPATSPGTHLFAYGKSDENLKEPDLLIFSGPFGTIADGAFNKKQNIYSITPSVCLPYSRGHVSLSSNDSLATPLVQPNLLGDDRDIQTLINAIYAMDNIANIEPFSSHVLERIKPRPEKFAMSRESLHDFVRDHVTTCHHSCGTCRMGEDNYSVVDSQLRVRGVLNLRVADASVFPSITSGNLNAPVIMLAEKAADLILAN